MATQIADIYEPLTFAEGIDEAAIELNAFYNSGVIVENANLTAQAAAGGRIGEVTGFSPLAQTEPNISSDDPSSHSTPEKVEKYTQLWRLAALNQSWSTMDLARELALKDPATAIISMIGQYWATEQEKRVIQSCMGILADNTVNDGGDMVYSVATDDVPPITAAEMISPQAVIMAKATMGDHGPALVAIAMHSAVYYELENQQVIDFIPPADSAVPVPYYLGMRVIVDDSLPAVAGTNRITYTSILFGSGAIGHGRGRVINPSELERIPSAGDGGGQEVLYSRTSDIYHPLGISFTSTSVADESAALAELALGANWDRVWHRKNVNIAFLQTNG